MREARNHFMVHVLPAAEEYVEAEYGLSEAARDHSRTSDAYFKAGSKALRKASELAVAISGLVDRVAVETGMSKGDIRTAIADRCVWQNGGAARPDAESRVRSVADAWKNHTLNGRDHTITGAKDVVAVGSGFGVDGFGVGKMGDPEVMVQATDGKQFKFLGDAHVMLRAWKAYLEENGEEVGEVTFPL